MELLKKLGFIFLCFAIIAFIAWLVSPAVGLGRSSTSTSTSASSTSVHKPLMQSFLQDFLGIPKCGIFGGGCSSATGSTQSKHETPISYTNQDIRVTNIGFSSVLQNNYIVRGQAKPTWFYQTVALGHVVESSGREIGAFQIKASSNTKTDTFVPFMGLITFSTPQTPTGYVIFEKANPTNDPKKVSKLYIPIVFENGFSSQTGQTYGNPYYTGATTTISNSNNTTTPKASGGCRVTGCSGEVCSDTDVVSTCEYRPEYACYRQANCERQANGSCGFTMTPTLDRCIDNANGLDDGGDTGGSGNGGLPNPQ